MTEGEGYGDDFREKISRIARAAKSELKAGEHEAGSHAGEQAAYEKESRELSLREHRQNIEERKKYANRIFYLIVGWLIAVLGIVVVHGCQSIDIRIQEPVLIALITGLSVNVLGIFIFVVKYLFPGK